MSEHIFRRDPGIIRYPLVFSAMLLACNVAAAPGDTMNIQYGRVAAEKAVDVKNHVGEATLIGGTLGAAIYNSGSRTGNVVTGAVLGAGVEALGEWRMKGTRYTIDTVRDEEIHIITDQTGIRVGDCVAIEATARHANLRRVSDTYCESASAGVEDHHLDARARKAAADCYMAKKALIGAEGEAEVEAAKRRVRALCDT
ncbi:MAG TPA: hypothetical protein ENK49_03155 [Gammaproteobacteria bacterium]|nr:hypothetical protein [Gammaproteobacteria bacterium]